MIDVFPGFLAVSEFLQQSRNWDGAGVWPVLMMGLGPGGL